MDAPSGHTSRLAAVVVDARDTTRLAAFWGRVLGATSVRRWTDARGTSFAELDVPGSGMVLLFQASAEPAGRGAVHLDVAPSAGTTQAGEVARLVAEGATVLADEPDLPWVVLADPEGNRFCVLPPRDG